MSPGSTTLRFTRGTGRGDGAAGLAACVPHGALARAGSSAHARSWPRCTRMHTRLTHGHERTRSSYELPCAVTAAFRLPQTPVTETKSPAAGPSLGSLSPVMRGLSLNHGLVRSDSGEERPAVSGTPRPGLLGGSWTSLLCGHVSLVTRSQTVSPCTWMSVTPQIPRPAPGTEEPAGRSAYQPARRGDGPTLPWGRGHRTWEGVRTSFSSTTWHPGSAATESVAFGRTLRTGRAQGSGAVGHGGQGRARRSSRCVHLVLRRASGTVGGAWGQPGQGRKPMPELAGASPCPRDRRNRAAARRVPTPLPPGLTSPVHVTSRLWPAALPAAGGIGEGPVQSGGHRPRRGCGSRRVLMQLIQVTEPMPQAVPAGTSWAPDSVPLSLSLSLCPSPFSFLLNKTTHYHLLYLLCLPNHVG